MAILATLVFLIEQTATGLYILLAVCVFLCWRGWSGAQQAFRGTAFELERDLARRRRTNAFTALVLLIEGGAIVAGLQFVVAPTLRDRVDFTEVASVTVQDGVFRTPTPPPLTGGIVIDASGVILGAEDPADQIQATPTLTPTPVGTIVPNVPAAIGCDTDNAMLQVPANGMIVFSPTTMIGRASIENFAFYRFEINGEITSGSFAPTGGDSGSPVTELGALGVFTPAYYPPGTYQLRLNVFDINNTVQASCTITIFISAPIPPATPIGGLPTAPAPAS